MKNLKINMIAHSSRATSEKSHSFGIRIQKFRKITPRHKTNTCRKKFLGNYCFCEYMRGLYSHSREYRKIFLRSHLLHVSQILEENYFGAYTCRACIRTRANTGKYSWGIIYVLVSCQGVFPERQQFPKHYKNAARNSSTSENAIFISFGIYFQNFGGHHGTNP